MVRYCIYLILVLVTLAGCSRTRYRMAADRDAHSLLLEKTAGAPWMPPSDFSLLPHPASRLFDPTPPDDPWLPHPAPQLYGYQLPELPPRTYRSGPELVPTPDAPAETLPQPRNDDQGMAATVPAVNPRRLPAVERPRATYPVQPAAHEVLVKLLPPPEEPAGENPPGTRPSSAQSGEPLLAPIPEEAWEAIPDSCLTRMFEFAKLREEYERSYGMQPGQEQLASGKRLALEDIIYLALMNSREYQTQKELLYRVSLRLSLERYAYVLKFSTFNNGTSVLYNHTRAGGTTVNGLSIPTNLQVEKMLVTGGDLVARFANNVVLTFNGPQGFAADVGSDLFLDLNQTVFQRDVRFESLTQAERDVVYEARDFVRFRKSLFVQLASQYYSLIRNYRQVEIESQNYFTLVRAFHQSTEEYRAGLLPRFQLDQVEQNVLTGRSRLIGSCNNLESALDNLKIEIGLPTENHINIDMGELDQLTTRDELSVAGELVRRVRRRLLEQRNAQTPNRLELLSSSVVLIERMLESQRLEARLGRPVPRQETLSSLLVRLQVHAARENAEVVRSELADAVRAQPPSLPRVFQRTMDLIDAVLGLIDRQIALAKTRADAAQVTPLQMRLAGFSKDAADLHEGFEKLVDAGGIDRLQDLLDQATRLQNETETLTRDLDALTGEPATEVAPQAEMQRALDQADELLRQSDELLQSLGVGLSPIEIAMDDAMLTAINLRLDLMNQRGEVADTWRQIKYAADDLKSVLNLNASHRLSTRSDINSPFAFTFDESDTRLRATFDAPFNRRAERNTYRQSLINYQASLRQLMLLEDNIKLAVRDDLRALALDTEQYRIDVASAALAYERVVSVLLELRLGIGRVAARDFLEAQNAYANSLSAVATRHIGYIVDRTQLFLDLELLNVGEDGFWPELYDEQYQPEPFYQLPTFGQPVYGELVPGLWYSKYLRRMEHIPPGTAAIHSENTAGENAPPSGGDPAELPPPQPE